MIPYLIEYNSLTLINKILKLLNRFHDTNSALKFIILTRYLSYANPIKVLSVANFEFYIY